MTLHSGNTLNSGAATVRSLRLAAYAVVAIALVAVAGWLGDVAVWRSVLPEFEPMQRSTAAALVVVGVGLWLATHARLRVRRWGGAIGGGVAFVLAVPGVGVALAGERLAPNASLGLMLAGAALATAVQPWQRRMGPAIAATLALVAAAIGAVALAGYAGDAASGYRWGTAADMALNSAFALFVLGLGAAGAVAWRQSWRWTLEASTTAYFLAGVALLLTVCAMSYRTLGALRHSSAQLTRSHAVRAELGTLQREIAEAGTARRAYSETGDTARLAENRAAMQRARKSLEELARLTRGNARHQASIAGVIALSSGRVADAAEAAGLPVETHDDAEEPAGSSSAARSVTSGEILLGLFNAIHDEEEARRRELERKAENAFRQAMLVVPVGTVASVSLLGLALLRLNRGAGELQRTLGMLRATEADLRQQKEEIRALNLGLERQVDERTAQLAAANKELEAFSYSVSHDLRAPLRHVQGYVAMLQRATDGRLPENAQRYLRVINDASVEMGNLIDDLLDFSRMARLELTRERVRLEELVQDVRRVLETGLDGRAIEWRVGALPEVTGDSAMLRQVLANLIGNAVKYTRQRAPALIEIGCAGEENGHAILCVRDNGAGFDMRYVDKLFGVFQRLHRADEFEGTGIGLATVRRVVLRHGGRVWAEGAVDRGATFYFTLPRAAV